MKTINTDYAFIILMYVLVLTMAYINLSDIQKSVIVGKAFEVGQTIETFFNFFATL